MYYEINLKKPVRLVVADYRLDDVIKIVETLEIVGIVPDKVVEENEKLSNFVKVL